MRTAPIMLLVLASCQTYEYEEEVFLEVDGSGRIRISGSREILEALHSIGNPSTETAREFFDDPAVELTSVRESERDGRIFLHVQARFSEWNELCRHPALADRDCRFRRTDDSILLESDLPRPRGSRPESLDPEARIAVRIHFPSTVYEHDSPNTLERGNILRWDRTLEQHFTSPPLSVKARFDRRSTLSRTIAILFLSLVLVVLGVTAALYLIARKGRRLLANSA